MVGFFYKKWTITCHRIKTLNFIVEKKTYFDVWKWSTDKSFTNYQLITPPNSEIICGQNVGTKVVCGMILFFEKKAMLKI